MLLVLEIWLTVKAWRAGWRGWALVPWAVGLVAVVALAGIGGDPTSAEDGSIVMSLFVDLALIATLAVMSRGRRPAAAGESHATLEITSQRAVDAAEL
jgi:hypothetical protein